MQKYKASMILYLKKQINVSGFNNSVQQLEDMVWMLGEVRSYCFNRVIVSLTQLVLILDGNLEHVVHMSF